MAYFELSVYHNSIDGFKCFSPYHKTSQSRSFTSQQPLMRYQLPAGNRWGFCQAPRSDFFLINTAMQSLETSGDRYVIYEAIMAEFVQPSFNRLFNIVLHRQPY